MDSLLAINATPIERALEYAMARIENVPNPVADVRNPYLCPTPLLPWLAWGASVDEWDESWTEAKKRAVIDASAKQHARRGTLGATLDSLALWGGSVSITEWYEYDPPKAPFTFDVTVVGGTDAGANIDAVERIHDAVKLNKPARARYELTIGSEFKTGVEMLSRVRFASLLRGRG